MLDMKKHLGIGKKVTIDGDEIEIAPLGVEFLSEFFSLAASFQHTAGDDTVNLLDKLEPKSIEAMKTFVLETLKRSPTMEGNTPEEVSQFAMKNFMTLIPDIMELNTPSVKSGEASKIERMKEALRKSNVAPPTDKAEEPKE